MGALWEDIIVDELELRGEIRVGDSLRGTLRLRIGVNRKMIEGRQERRREEVVSWAENPLAKDLEEGMREQGTWSFSLTGLCGRIQTCFSLFSSLGQRAA